MKEVVIKLLNRDFVVGGLMSFETYMRYIKENGGLLDCAEQLWNEATRTSLFDYCGRLYVRVNLPTPI